MRELSVITYPHLRILPITSADNPRNISPQFTRLNISAPHIRILPEAYISGCPKELRQRGGLVICELRTGNMRTNSANY